MGKNGDKDELLGRTGEFTFSELGKRQTVKPASFDAESQHAEELEAIANIPTQPDYYPPPSKFDREYKRAETVYAEYLQSASLMINAVRTGQALNVKGIVQPLTNMINSVIQHPDAMIWMRRLHVDESYLIGHSVRTSVLAAVLGRHMGMEESALYQVTLAALLCQIGKTKLRRQLLEKPGPLTREEVEQIQGFVAHGVEILESTPAIDREVIRIVANHHERFDGSGYPEGKQANYIPVPARMVGLVDWYDAMTSVKPYTDKVISSTEAMDYLYSQRNILFQDQLVEEFIQSIGMYPNGNLVLLNTEEVALILAQDTDNRTQPSVLIVLNHAKKHYKQYQKVNLFEHNREHPDQPRIIKQALRVDAHGLDAKTIIEKFTSQKKGWRKLF